MNQKINFHIGKKLRLRRTALGLTQENVAKSIGITFQQIQKYEKGTNTVSALRLFEFSQLLNVPVAYFFEGIEEASPHKNSQTSSDREVLEIMKAFKDITDPNLRKRLADLVRSVAQKADS